MKLILTFVLCLSFTIANDNFINMKECEVIKLSKLTTLVSCHKIDYLIEYRVVDDEEIDKIKKITAITQKEQRVIKETGR